MITGAIKNKVDKIWTDIWAGGITKPPFDKPISFIKLFDAKTRSALMETINQVRENAVRITAS